MGRSRKEKVERVDICVRCGCLLGVGVEAWRNPDTGTWICPMCAHTEVGPAPDGTEDPATPNAGSAGSDSESDRGQAGASAMREYERRRARREQRTRDAHPRIGDALLLLSGAPQHEIAFKKGAAGERAVGSYLEKRLADTPVVLMHDRRMPRGHGNIDHLAVAPTGVYVIDAKNIDGKVRVEAPLFGPKKLMIKGRNRTKLIDGLDRQVKAVTNALAVEAPAIGLDRIDVHGVLCFINVDLPMLGTQSMRGHRILYRRGVVKRLKAQGPLDKVTIGRLAERLATAFPPA